MLNHQQGHIDHRTRDDDWWQIFTYLNNFDHQAKGEGHGEEDEQDRDDDQEVGAHTLTLLTGWNVKQLMWTNGREILGFQTVIRTESMTMEEIRAKLLLQNCPNFAGFDFWNYWSTLTNFVFVWINQSLFFQFPIPVPILVVELRHLLLLLVLLLLVLVRQLAFGELLLD